MDKIAFNVKDYSAKYACEVLVAKLRRSFLNESIVPKWSKEEQQIFELVAKALAQVEIIG